MGVSACRTLKSLGGGAMGLRAKGGRAQAAPWFSILAQPARRKGYTARNPLTDSASRQAQGHNGHRRQLHGGESGWGG